ncbi:glycoside hydrolase family 31 protein [Clavulina sp. PMI_390]|nr:glycoside hydrolase family 31 protein [Clavulina sp. PMI_390]
MSCSGYTVTSIHHTSSSIVATLSLAGLPCYAFGNDIHDLILSVDYETNSRLHVHIYDAAQKQFQIPENLLPRPPSGSSSSHNSDLEFHYETHPFAFWIVRKRTGDVIFDTRPSHIPIHPEPLGPSEKGLTNATSMPAHPLVFSDQYLQISSSLPYNANVYGLGEYYSGNYRRNPSSTVQPFWALDIGDPMDANMYGYHAVYQEIRSSANGGMETHAVWFKNSAGLDVILRDGVIQYRAIGGTLDFYFYSGDKSGLIPGRPQSPRHVNSPANVIEQYVQSIGLPQVPPTWAFGFHQCRWGYDSIAELQEAVDSMRNASIPLETAWSDIDWMHAYRNFVSDPLRFDPEEFKAFIDGLHQNHQHYIPIIDAAIGVQVPNGTDKYDTAARGMELDVFVKTAGGKDYVGIVWPGYTYFPDWWSPRTQEWWDEAFHNMSSFMKFDGIWLDMNEPSSFCVGSCGSKADWNKQPPNMSPHSIEGWPEGYDYKRFGDSGNITVNGSWTFNPEFAKVVESGAFSFALDGTQQKADLTLRSADLSDGRFLSQPPYAIHNAHGPIDSSTVAANATTKIGVMYDVKNLWGFAEEAHTHKTLLGLHPGKRPFLISRSTFAGSGKYTGHWLGDNRSTWRDLWLSIQGVFQFQLFGIPMVGADICGFGTNTDEELCNRWMALGAWHPFFRNHNVLKAIPQEPYRWDSVADVSRKVLAARYSLLPVWQTLFARASEFGTPTIRPLWHEFPGQGYESADRQFLVGTSLLVTPVLMPNVSSVSGVFPAAGGPWRDFWTHEVLNVEAGINTTIPAPLSHIPVHIRPGTVLVTYSKPGYTTYETTQSPYRLIISLDEKGQASGEVYYDDGESQWTGRAPGSTAIFSVSRGRLTSIVMEGQYSFASDVEEIVILGVAKEPTRVMVENNPSVNEYNPKTQSLSISSLSLNLNEPITISWT